MRGTRAKQIRNAVQGGDPLSQKRKYVSIGRTVINHGPRRIYQVVKAMHRGTLSRLPKPDMAI